MTQYKTKQCKRGRHIQKISKINLSLFTNYMYNEAIQKKMFLQGSLNLRY